MMHAMHHHGGCQVLGTSTALSFYYSWQLPSQLLQKIGAFKQMHSFGSAAICKAYAAAAVRSLRLHVEA
jgi:hypothetical protein